MSDWCNNRISKNLYEDYPKDFSLCDIDGAVKCFYKDQETGKTVIRFIIYESKNEHEREMGKSQLSTLKIIDDAINWKQFDKYSGLYVLKIKDIDNEIIWENLQSKEIRRTTFEELYNIFSCKVF